MSNRGFSLIELIIVIGLIGILLAAATFGFMQYSRKSQMTNQTRLLYGDLMEYRTKALYEKRNWTFKISASGYGIYSSANTAVTPVTAVTLRHTVNSNNATDIIFDSQGLANISSKSVCISNENDAAVDSVVISTTMVQIGKRRVGTTCAAANIDAQ